MYSMSSLQMKNSLAGSPWRSTAPRCTSSDTQVAEPSGISPRSAPSIIRSRCLRAGQGMFIGCILPSLHSALLTSSAGGGPGSSSDGAASSSAARPARGIVSSSISHSHSAPTGVRVLHPLVKAARAALVDRQRDQLDAIPELAREHLGRVVGAGVVHHQHAVGRPRLVDNRRQALPQQLLAVVGHDHGADGGHGGGSLDEPGGDGARPRLPSGSLR